MNPSSQTLSVAINADPAAVYAFVSDPRNLPQWAPHFCRTVEPAADDGWRVTTPTGAVTVSFCDFNDFGVLDHHVYLPDGSEIYVPMRVVDSGDASTILMTLFRMPTMSEAQYQADLKMAEQDLMTLKQLMESGTAR